MCIFFGILSIGLKAQTRDFEKINFDDTIYFNKKIIHKTTSQPTTIQYEEINGTLSKLDYFDSKNRKTREKIWKADTLVKHTEYTYLENDQVIKYFDSLNHKDLPTRIRMNIKYPPLAMENEISGTIDVKLIYDQNYIPISYKVLTSLGHGIDEEVDKKMKQMMAFAKKHNVSFKDLDDPIQILKINFSLEEQK